MRATKTLTPTLAHYIKVGDTISEIHPAGEEHGTLTYQVRLISRGRAVGALAQTIILHCDPNFYTGGILLGKNFHLAPTDEVTVQTLTES